ncbi:RagB/SusD family nutrient uptake outer membrane protein [Capnocytophaga canis]|uniref:RagB/SusD family nutrient uptake outer membrane protein n=1 Tax=Capnocytophaga canis TaxID=1848903 RepID=A0A3A1YJU9_9FLAO|nr:RagB/SusD family nutrient uptake outer membrane protein [Capnocytophaga canis]RIY36307.1 RagB/SusD family nutrient uptake outer membrane protein [Capnocytophaga canis]
MNRFYKTILALSLVLTIGCSKDFLDTKPSDQMGDVDAETTAEGLKAIVNGMHNMMYMYNFGGQVGGRGQQGLAAQLDMLGDDMINTKPAYHMGIYRYQDHHKVNNDDYINFKTWDYYYTIIQHANKVIAGTEGVSLLVQDRQTILGEAHAFRAFAYHNLVQLFGKRYVKGAANDQLGVIIRTPDKLEDHLPRATVAEVYEYIENDITIALTNLKNAPDKKIKNAIRYSTVCGIAARIALTKSEWAQAEEYAKLAINHSGATLQVGNSLIDGFRDYSATEWMWGYTQNTEQQLYYAHFNASFSYNFGGHNRSLRFAVNRDIYDEMGTKDVRRKWWVCLDRGDVIPADADSQYFEGGVKAHKWEITGQSVKFKALSATDSRGDTVLMRLAEMYYILAEAQAQQGKDAEAQATLNRIMKTRDEDYSTTATGNALKDEIMRNKRIDLWMEGQRFFDMKRLGVIPNRLNSKNIQVYLEGPDKQTAIVRNSGNNTVNLPKTIDSKFWQFAIPYGEITGNPLCKQNEL